MSFAADILNNNDKGLVLDDDCSFDMDFLSKHNESGDSHTAKNIDNCESRITQKAAIIPFRTNRNTPYPASKPVGQSHSSAQNIHAPTSSKRRKAKILPYNF